ncbi:MAG TPA: hypothetical protein PLF37_07470, partial [Planctomycetota bacterium]|nr:hypothetical protein [Planctomycetota bacterium]
MKRSFAGVIAFAVALALGGCSGGEDGGDTVVSGARIPPGLPTLATVRWQSDGGSALGQAPFSGGAAGSVNVNANNGGIHRYGGQALPAVSKNLLATAGPTITYANLVTLLTPSIGGTTATFTLPVDTGFHLGAGSTLNLSDAAAGVVDSVVIEGIQPIRIDGSIVTARSGASAVDIGLTHTGGTELGLVVTGSINASGAPTRDGGGVSLFSLSSLVLTGTIDSRGGAASAAMMSNGRPGGDIQVNTQFGDILLSAGSFSARGGAAEGTGSGGAGGSVSLTSASNSPVDFHGQAVSYGGASVSGNAGSSGSISVAWAGAGSAFLYLDSTGGASTGTGAGNNAGSIVVNGSFTTFKGSAVLLANGGSSATGTGGDAGSISVIGHSFELARFQARSNGGSGNAGGDGDEIVFIISGPQGSKVLDVVIDAVAEGGDGTASGGDGGGVVGFSGSAASGRFVNIQASTAGGDGAAAGTGSVADNIFFEFGTLFGATIVANTSGGNGTTAGNAGGWALWVANGTNISHTVTANGGNGADAGNGGAGSLTFVSIRGLTQTVTANGGTGTTVDGGNGGFVGFSSMTISPLLEGNLSYTMAGGAATTGAGGNGGALFFNISGGRFVGSLSHVGDGGSATAGMGNGGNSGTSDFTFSTFEGSLVVQTSGGNSVGGTAGLAQSKNFNPLPSFAGVSRFTRFEVTARGGNSDTGNGGTGAFFNWNSPLDLELAATIDLSGGQGSVVSGNGMGGMGGSLFMNSGPSRLNVNLALTNRGGNGRGNGNGGMGGGVNLSGGDVRVRGTYDSAGGNVLGTGTGGGGNAGMLQVSAQFGINVGGAFNALGGSAVGGIAGGQGGSGILQCGSGSITSSAVFNRSGGAG